MMVSSVMRDDMPRPPNKCPHSSENDNNIQHAILMLSASIWSKMCAAMQGLQGLTVTMLALLNMNNMFYKIL